MSDPKRQAYQAVQQLVQNFQAEQATPRPDAEIRTRTVFINKFFDALGWQVENRQQVVYEDRVGEGGRPDYGFYTQGDLRFFVEAKAAQKDLRADRAGAFQVRRYGWSAKLPLSILTNFQELAVYYCHAKPDELDNPDKARLEYLHIDQYQEDAVWDFLYDTFSRQAVESGALERYIQAKQKQTALRLPRPLAVDDDFLNLIDQWRVQLAQNLQRDKKVASSFTQEQMNQVVQRTIDRIIFLRVAEDRGIDQWGLEALSKSRQSDIYLALLDTFRRADTRYNSGLFYFSPRRNRVGMADTLASQISFSDQLLQSILRGFYEQPYRFDVIPADILGNVYERFLGKVISLQNNQVEVEEKPEVRRAGGVYYTPKYIVDYIVAQTVGKLLPPITAQAEEKSPLRLRGGDVGVGLKILDPACGSGSFLIAAYQYLLDWYLELYRQDPKKYKTQLLKLDNDYQLTLEERKRILLAHIYGVDIDPQAVEVAKLNLLLKVLEVKRGAMAEQQALLREHILPELEANIRCGNSLIGTDYATPHTPQAEKARLFDWDVQFREVMASGGFDAVIGNPPYGAIISQSEDTYYRGKYSTARYSNDTYILFMEKTIHLLKNNGLFGMIIPSGWVSAPTMKSLREIFASNFKPTSFVTLPYDIFNAAYVDTVVVVAEKPAKDQVLDQQEEVLVNLVVFPIRHKIRSVDDFNEYKKLANAKTWLNSKDSEFLITLSDTEQSIIDKMRHIGTRFCDVADIQRGVTPFDITPAMPSQNPKRAFTGTVRRYTISEEETGYIRYDETLKEYKAPRYFTGERLLLRELISRQFSLQAVYTSDDFITNKSMQSFLLTDKHYHIFYLLGLLNSKLISWFFLAVHSVARRDDFPKIVLKQSRELPFRAIKFDKPADVQAHDQMVALVTQMLDLQSQLAATPQDSFLLQRVERVDMEIDKLVYQLYGLTDDEIALVEGRAS